MHVDFELEYYIGWHLSGIQNIPGTVVGECTKYSMQAAPVPCPNKVTRLASPPNC